MSSKVFFSKPHPKQKKLPQHGCHIFQKSFILLCSYFHFNLFGSQTEGRAFLHNINCRWRWMLMDEVCLMELIWGMD